MRQTIHGGRGPESKFVFILSLKGNSTPGRVDTSGRVLKPEIDETKGASLL